MSVNIQDRIEQLNKQLAMYKAFRDVDGAAAVLRELQDLTKGISS